MNLDCDVQAPIVEVEVGGSSSYSSSNKSCGAIILWAATILVSTILMAVLTMVAPGLGRVWYIVFGIINIAALVFLVFAILSCCKVSGNTYVEDEGVIEVEYDQEVGGSGNVGFSVEMPVVEIEYEVSAPQVEFEVEIEAPQVEFEVEIEVPEVEVEIEVEIEVPEVEFEVEVEVEADVEVEVEMEVGLDVEVEVEF